MTRTIASRRPARVPNTKPHRTAIPQVVVDKVLVDCRRRCALCFVLEGRTGVKDGQIAHADRDPHNNAAENLVYLCLRHHNAYDRQARQSRGFSEAELLAHRAALLDYLAKLPAAWADNPIRLSARRRPLATDVYERKIAIYRAVRALVIKVTQDATIEWHDLFTFNAATDEAIFMFGVDVDEYLKELHQRCVLLHVTHVQLSNGRFGTQPGEDRSQTVHENVDHLSWFTKQLDVVRQLFSRYIYI